MTRQFILRGNKTQGFLCIWKEKCSFHKLIDSHLEVDVERRYPVVSPAFGYSGWIGAAVVVTLIGLIYHSVLVDLASDWWDDPALSQGLLIPPVALFVAWTRRSLTFALPAAPDRRGLVAVALSSLAFIVGKVGAEYFLMRVSFVLLLAGLAWTYWGYPRLRTLALPFLLLATMIPLPRVVYNSISPPLQLLASGMAANFARALGVTVYLDGNIIHLAAIRLGVEEACNGMNSLYSLAVASPLLGILLCTRMASRLILLAVAIPLAVCINILRITGTALLADYRPDLAIGFYHSFAGWLVFLAGFLGLYLFARILHACID